MFRSLQWWLAEEPELRGRVRLVQEPMRPDSLGGWPEALTVVLAPGGAVVVLASAVVAWARRQSVGNVVCKLIRSDGTEVEVSAPLARSLGTVDEVRALVESLTRQLGSEAASGPHTGE
ncbi:effector-associated constant component EACC1 [Streptomyces sp. NBC_01715]|uniref:effector-associated constant component EACC1 n=1 Tax=Streptomyces sp. NBC_01715 TaxID=2975916 RepID=UPI003FCC84D1